MAQELWPRLDRRVLRDTFMYLKSCDAEEHSFLRVASRSRCGRLKEVTLLSATLGLGFVVTELTVLTGVESVLMNSCRPGSAELLPPALRVRQPQPPCRDYGAHLRGYTCTEGRMRIRVFPAFPMS